jgi:hypothetical protein
MRERILQIHSLAILCVGMWAVPAMAQLDTGIIEGTVKDSTGAAIPKAPVTVTETNTNNSFNVLTDALGNYVSPPLKVGTYKVTVGATGFKTFTRAGIVLQVQDRLRVDAQLEVGSRTELVMVTGEVPPVQTDTSSLGTVITQQQLEDMPLNGRNYIGLATLTTGVIDTSQNNTNGNTAGAFSANGVRGDLNNYVLDGVDNNSNDNGGSTQQVNLEAIAEFKIQTSSYDAEFGRAGGAALNVVIKSGTNQIHGSLFEFYQNAYMNAQNFFAVTNALSTKYNQPGGALGFPIIKNKLFFFGDWQLTDQHTPTADRTSVPVAGEATGNFSGGIHGVNNIYDPTTLNPATGLRQPYPNNIIPINQISPLGLAYAALYPQPDVPGAVRNNYVTEPTTLSSTMQGDGRADYRMTEADSIFARFSESGETTYTPPMMPGLACGCRYRSGNTFYDSMGASVGETHIFTATTLNEFRAGFSWYYTHVGVPQGGYQAVPSNLAIPGIVADPSDQGLPNMAPSGGYSALGLATYTPTWLSTSEREIRDTLNLVRGRHTIRLGGEIRWSQFNLFQLNDPRGAFSFTGQYTSQDGSGIGNGLADMLLGIPQQSLIDSYVYLGNREPVPALFFQDDFKVSHNLTLNLGVRWEYFSPIVDVHNRQANFDYATGQLLQAGQKGNSDALATAQKTNFGPRVGFAYTPIADTVIRGAFGIFYSGQEIRTGDPLQLQYNLPYYYQPTFVGDGVTPALTLAQGFPPLNASQAINPGATSLDTNPKTPYYQEWNVTVQRALPGRMSLEVAYVGSKGVHLQGLTDQNQDMVPGPGDVQSRRPYPFYSGFASMQMRGNANFSSLQFKMQKRLSHGLYFLSSYTFSRGLDDLVPICCNSPYPDDSYNLHLLKGLADYQQKNRWVTSFDYLLPFGKGQALLNNNSRALNLILGGWHWTGIFTMTSGFPFTPTMGYDSSNTGTQGATLPDRIGNGNISGSQRTIYNWFNLNAFTDAAANTFGNSGYNVLIGPGFINLDFGLRKVVEITERQTLQLRLESFNTINHPNWSLPDSGIDDGPGAAGVITSTANNNRIVQLGLVYRF